MNLETRTYGQGGRLRVTGRARFGCDQGREGDLLLACRRAEKAPCRILEIDPTPALSLPGVVRVFTARDIPGENRLGIIPLTKDQEFLAHELVRHPGQALALVAAESAEAARAGARAIRVRLQDLPGVYDAAAALEPGAPLVHPGWEPGNLLLRRRVVRGDVEAALRESAVVVEGEYSTSPLAHASLEPEGGRAELVEGRVVITACTQNPHYDQQDIARFLGVDPERVRVIQAETGGGFGGKLDLSVQPFLALAAWHLGRPVRMTYTREESFLATAKRHPLQMHYLTGADERGRITAMKVDILGDTGAFASYGLAVCLRAAAHACGPYRVPHLHITSSMAYTHTFWKGAMRGFGVPQVALGHEGQMDALARALEMDPLEIRLLNALRPGDTTATGQVLEGGVGLVACLEAIRPRYHQWGEQAGREGEFSRGVGLGAMFYGIGNTGVSNPSTAQLWWRPDGRVVLYTGAADIGQGSDLVLTRLAAARLGLEPERIELVRADTDLTTNAGATSASRQTFISGNAVLDAAGQVEAIILEEAQHALEAARADLVLEQGRVWVRGSPDRGLAVEEVLKRLAVKGVRARGQGRFDPDTTALDPETGQGSPYQTYAFAAQAVLAQVDRGTAEVRALKVAAAHDVGRAINRRAVEGQIRGGVMMGLGMALMEEYHPGCRNLADYHIPTLADAPEIEPIIVEEPSPDGPQGAKGVGEPALIPTAPALAGAVGQALGRPLRRLPLSLERVMEAIQQDKE